MGVYLDYQEHSVEYYHYYLPIVNGHPDIIV